MITFLVPFREPAWGSYEALYTSKSDIFNMTGECAQSEP